MSADARDTGVPADRHQWLQDLCAAEPVCITARGDCMAPLIEDGARLQVSPARRYYPGDIIVCRAANGSYLVHRLLGSARWRGSRQFVTRGDNNERVDGLVRAGGILGKVIGGDCDTRVIHVPAGHRLAALGQFMRFALRRVSTPSG